MEEDGMALQKIQGDLLRNDAGEANPMKRINDTIRDLNSALSDVEPSADRVDKSTADFAQRSRSRIRYIQDIGSARRQQIKTIFDFIVKQEQSTRLSHMEDTLNLPDMRISDCGLIGIESLKKKRNAIDPGSVEPVADMITDDDREESILAMERNVRNALSVKRANRFFDGLGIEPGEVMSSVDMPVRTEDDIIDLLSILVFAPSGGAHYNLHTLRIEEPGDVVAADLKGDFNVDRFEVTTK